MSPVSDKTEITPAATVPDISVVVPVYNSESCLDELVKRNLQALKDIGRSGEVVLVNDCSPDRSWERVVELSRRFPGVRGICLRRNFGQDCALMAGLRAARGGIIVIMDDDLQHDPAEMGGLIAKVEEGYDVCYADFLRLRQALWKNFGSWLNDRLANLVLGKPRNVYLSPYKAVTADVIREIIKYDGPFPYVDGLIFRVTHHIAQAPARHHDRFAGRSNYNLVRSVGVWLRVATSFSVIPVRIAAYVGFAFSGLGLALALFFAVLRLVSPGMPMGWASTIVAVLLLGGVQLVSVGMLGEYLGRVFLHLNRKPQYAIREQTDVTASPEPQVTGEAGY